MRATTRDRTRRAGPPTIRGTRRSWFGRAVVVLGVLSTLVGIACGGGGGDAADPGDGTLPELTAVSPELAAIDQAATLHSRPLTQTVGPEADILELQDGSSLQIPEGAFTEPTELSISIIDLTSDPEIELSRAYVLTAELPQSDDAVGELMRPVVLVLPWDVDAVIVAELANGAVSFLPASPGPSAQIQIDHFSTRQFVVLKSHERMDAATRADTDIMAVCDIFLALRPEVSWGHAGVATAICYMMLGGDRSQTGPPPPSSISPEDQAWIAYVVGDTANDLMHAGVGDFEISGAKTMLRACLTDKLESGSTKEAAYGECESTASVPGQSPPQSTTQPAQPAPTSVAGDAVTIEDLGVAIDKCTGPVSEAATDKRVSCGYNFSFTAAYSTQASPAVVICRVEDWSQEVSLSTPSGTVEIAIRPTFLVRDSDGNTTAVAQSATIACEVFKRAISPRYELLASDTGTIVLPSPE